MNTTTEQEILQFAADNWGEKDIPAALLKLSEEMGEVAGACVKIGENRSTWDEFDDEVGDVLIVLSQVAALRGRTLDELREARFEKIKARAARKPACAVCDWGDYTIGHSTDCLKAAKAAEAAKAYVCDCGDRSLGLRGECVKTEQPLSPPPPPQNKLYAISLAGISRGGEGHLRMWSVLVTAETPEKAVEHFKAETLIRYFSYDFTGSTAIEITSEHIDKLNAANGHTV